MATRQLVAAATGLLVAVGPPSGGDPVTEATRALRRLGYSAVSVTLCRRLVPREWVCLIGSGGVTGRLGWIHFHRAGDGSFVVEERRAGVLAP